MNRQRNRRLTDDDHHFGPLTYGFSRLKTYGLVYCSGGDQECDGTDNHLFGHFGKLVWRLDMPNLLQPKRIRHYAGWDEATVQRLGRNYYTETHPREYGITYGEGHVSILHGTQTFDSSTTQSTGFFLPWTQWRFIRHSIYDEKGNLFYTFMAKDRTPFEHQFEIEKRCPKERFEFDDYDGKRIIATTMIEEREWKFGTGWCKWLSIFRKPRISRSLKLEFSEEVGPEKGSWKGGIVGHGIDMYNNELHREAFQRYCDMQHIHKGRKYQIYFVRQIPKTHSEKILDKWSRVLLPSEYTKGNITMANTNKVILLEPQEQWAASPDDLKRVEKQKELEKDAVVTYHLATPPRDKEP